MTAIRLATWPSLLRNAIVELTVSGPALLLLRRLWPQGTQATAMLPKGGREHGACSGAASTSGRADVWPRLGSATQMTPAILQTILNLILSLNLTPFLALFLLAPILLPFLIVIFIPLTSSSSPLSQPFFVAPAQSRRMSMWWPSQFIVSPVHARVVVLVPCPITKRSSTTG